MAHRRAAATALASLHDFGSAATADVHKAGGGTDHRARQQQNVLPKKNQNADASERHRQTSSLSFSTSWRLPQPSTKSLLVLFLVVAAMQYHRRGHHVPFATDTDTDFADSASFVGSSLVAAAASATATTKDTHDGEDGAHPGGASFLTSPSGAAAATAVAAASRVRMLDADAGRTASSDPCDPEWGFDDGSEDGSAGDEADDGGGSASGASVGQKTESKSPPPRLSPPPPHPTRTTFGHLLGRMFTGKWRGGGGEGGIGAEEGRHTGRDGFPCVLPRQQHPHDGGGGGEEEEEEAGAEGGTGSGGAASKKSRKARHPFKPALSNLSNLSNTLSNLPARKAAAKRAARMASLATEGDGLGIVDEAMLATAMRMAGVSGDVDGGGGGASVSASAEEAEEERKQLQFARRHSRREAKRLKGVYELIRGVSVLAAEEEENATGEGDDAKRRRQNKPAQSLRASLRDAATPKPKTPPPPSTVGCGPRGEGPACAAGLHEGVCQVVGGQVTQVMNQRAIVRRGFVHESSADNAGHEGASMAAAANATVRGV